MTRPVSGSSVAVALASVLISKGQETIRHRLQGEAGALVGGLALGQSFMDSTAIRTKRGLR